MPKESQNRAPTVATAWRRGALVRTAGILAQLDVTACEGEGERGAEAH